MNTYIYDPRLGNVRSYGKTLREVEMYHRGAMRSLALHRARALACCEGACVDEWSRNRERSRLELAARQRATL